MPVCPLLDVYPLYRDETFNYFSFKKCQQEVNKIFCGGDLKPERLDYFFFIHKDSNGKSIFTKVKDNSIKNNVYKYHRFEDFKEEDSFLEQMHYDLDDDFQRIYSKFLGVKRNEVNEAIGLEALNKYFNALCEDPKFYLFPAKKQMKSMNSNHAEKPLNKDLYILSEIVSYRMIFALFPSLVEIFYSLTFNMFCNLIFIKNDFLKNQDNKRYNMNVIDSLIHSIYNINLRQERLFIVDKVIDNHKEIVSYMHLDCSPDQYIFLNTIATKKIIRGLF